MKIVDSKIMNSYNCTNYFNFDLTSAACQTYGLPLIIGSSSLSNLESLDFSQRENKQYAEPVEATPTPAT